MASLKRIVFLMAAALSVSATLVIAGDADSNVLVLTDDNFDSTLADVDVALVEFYAPWCGHCKALEPKYNEAADEMVTDNELKGVRLAKMDADAEKRVPGKFGVSGFPTLKLFRNGQFAEEYDGGRTKEDIIAFMKKKAAMAVNKEIATLSALKTLTNVKTCPRTTVVGFFSSKDSVDYKYFAAVAAQLASTGIDIYHTSTPAVLEGFGFYSNSAAIMMYRPGQKPFKVVYRGTIFKQQLKEWVMASALPKFGGEYTPETEGVFRQHGGSVVRFVGKPADVSATVTKAFQESLSKSYPSIIFASSDVADYKADFDAHCDKNVAVCILATEGKNMKKGQGRIFGSTGAFTEENAKQFVSDFSALKLKVKVKSQPAPPAPKAGAVAQLVGSTFESIAMDDTKDVLIKFYAPWCGHCKSMAPKYEQLAKDLADEFDDLVIADMDMTANDIPADFDKAYKVEGFPTLYYAPKGKKRQPIKYDGAREVEDFKKWLAEKRA